MKQLTVAAVNGGMVRYRSTKAAQQNIARLCRGQGHPVKAGDRHIVQVKVLTVAPPVILAMKIRHQSPPDGMHPGTGCNSPSPRAQSAVPSGAARSGICECHPGRPATRAVRFLSAAAGQPRSAGAAHRDDCGPVPQSPLHLCPQPVFRCNTKIRLRLCRDIHTRDIPLPLRRSHH